MLITMWGKIADGLYMLGEGLCLVYIVKGKEAAIIGGGMSWIAPRLEEQLAGIDIALEDIRYLVIPHAHFDHCGAVPYLKRKMPWIKVLASQAAKNTFAKQKVIDYIELANLVMIERFGLKDQYVKMGLKIDSLPIDQVVDGSSIISLGGGMDIQFIECPGHSPDTMAAYVPKLKAVFPTDAAPTPQGGIDKLSRPSAQYSYTLYKQSLAKLIEREIEICAFDHFAAVTGPDARQVLINGLKLCDDYSRRIVGLYKENGDLEKTARVVAHETLDSFDFGPEDLMMPVARAEVRNILKDAGILLG